MRQQRGNEGVAHAINVSAFFFGIDQRSLHSSILACLCTWQKCFVDTSLQAGTDSGAAPKY
jgi:hypothetical protein